MVKKESNLQGAWVMRFVLLGSRDTYIGKINNRTDFREMYKGKAMEYDTNTIINRHIFILYDK